MGQRAYFRAVLFYDCYLVNPFVLTNDMKMENLDGNKQIQSLNNPVKYELLPEFVNYHYVGNLSVLRSYTLQF